MSTSQRPLAAVCQMTATPNKAANFSACTQLVEEAKEQGAAMVFLPEGFDYIGSSREETLSLSEPLTGDTIRQYCQLARWENLPSHQRSDSFLQFCIIIYINVPELIDASRVLNFSRKLGIWLSLGGFHERGLDWGSDRRIYNSHIIIDKQGAVCHSQTLPR